MNLSENLRIVEEFLIRMEKLKDTLSPEVQETAADLCNMLRIGRAEVHFFDTQFLEQSQKGKTMILYDSGCCDDERYITDRRTTGISNVVVYKIFQRKDDEDWNEEESEKINLFTTMLFVFNGRTRLMEINRKLTFYDNDLNIHNLKYYLRYIGELLAKDKLIGYAAIYMNLKRFSVVNLQLGRELGTVVMRRFIDCINTLLEPDELVCRIGGDNFALLVRQENLNKILRTIEGTAIVYDDATGERILVSATAGIYIIDGTIPVHAPTDIMDRISLAVSLAKTRTKHDTAYFDEIMMTRNQKAMEVSSMFPKALEKEEFLVYYQPKIAIDGYKIGGAEALCRWKHDGKLISPAEFIPVLERSLDICKLDFYMLDHVCRDIRRWLDEGRNVVKISVNLSRRHLTDMDLLEHILEIVERNNIPHEYIELELTETTTDVEFKDLKRVISGLQEKGISTSVDDFGVGYSSLTLIKDIPWNVLKVDKSFLPEVGEQYDAKKKIMLKYVVAMAQEMGLECVAEGVETREQVELLKNHCCDLIQGFYFDKPLPVEEFESRLDNYVYTLS